MGIQNDNTFVAFCKETSICSDENISLYTKLHYILTCTEQINYPLKIIGQYKINRITLNISRYLHEDHEMLLITVK